MIRWNKEYYSTYSQPVSVCTILRYVGTSAWGSMGRGLQTHYDLFHIDYRALNSELLRALK